MPMSKVADAQKQARMFFENLTRKLNSKNKLYKLRSLINWSDLEKEISHLTPVAKFGREKKSLRVMLGLGYR